MAIRIARTLPATRFILLSGQASTAERMRQATPEGHHFELLATPIHPEELIARLRPLKAPTLRHTQLAIRPKQAKT